VRSSDEARRRDEPITQLPRPRRSRRDRHHLFWPASDYRRYRLTRFRGLKCTSAWNLDSMVHTLIHQCYADALGLAQNEYDRFQNLAAACIERHNQQQCGCIWPGRNIVLDIFSLKPLRPEQPPCLSVEIDRDVIELMRLTYQPQAEVTFAARHLLEERCRGRLCACPLDSQGHNAYRPVGWNWDTPLTA
jgi:hypothetical protein